MRETFVSLPISAVRSLRAGQEKDGAVGKCKSKCQLPGCRRLHRLVGVTLFSNIQAGWQSGGSQYAPCHDVSGDAKGVYLCHSHLSLRFLASVASLS